MGHILKCVDYLGKNQAKLGMKWRYPVNLDYLVKKDI